MENVNVPFLCRVEALDLTVVKQSVLRMHTLNTAILVFIVNFHNCKDDTKQGGASTEPCFMPLKILKTSNENMSN